MVQITNAPQSAVVFSTANGVTGDVFAYSFPERYERDATYVHSIHCHTRFAVAYERELDHWVDLIEGRTKEALIKEEDCVLTAQYTIKAALSRNEQRVFSLATGEQFSMLAKDEVYLPHYDSCKHALFSSRHLIDLGLFQLPHIHLGMLVCA
jgi:hypothetical protein